MKKVILSAAALLIGGLAFGQVSNSVGTAPDADPVLTLSTDPAANTGLSIQNGDNNRVRVRQAGTSQSVRTTQDNGTGIGGNMAWLMQTGEVQAASGVENVAEVQQTGSANESFTKQEGDFNDAFTAQGQNNDASSGNKARIRQGTGQQAQNNFAAIEQDGDDNIAFTRQTYDDSEAWTQQIGNENKSMVLQNAGPNQTDGHSAYNGQEGDRNESAIDQSGAGARNTAVSYQLGNDNQAKQTQIATAGVGGAGNRAVVGQGWSTSPIVAGETGLLSDFIFTKFPVSNWFFDTASYGSQAKQTQVGEGNDAIVFQTLGASYGEQEQLGDNNEAVINQGSPLAPVAMNYAKQFQSGDDNDAGITQFGFGNKSLQDQQGSENTSYAVQFGNMNLLNIHQRGDNNFATSEQHGDSNAGLIVQHGGQSYSLEQGVRFGVQAYGNQADILQMGPDGDFGAGAIPCDFEFPMNLDMDYSVPPVVIEDVCPDC